MIKIKKASAPQVLIDNKDSWTAALKNAIDRYGGYDKIPDQEKQALLYHYRHNDIKKALAESSHSKCAFCESKPGESGNIEVEHFSPKSLYPDLTFEWDNLLPACRKCNEAKLAFDTIDDPIIDPSKIDPETVLTYNYLRICPIKGTENEKRAMTTIDVCNLNSNRLYTARAKLMRSLTEYTDGLKDRIEGILEADTDRKRKTRITKLRNSLDEIDSLLRDDSVYAGFCRWFVSQCPEYMEAKRMVAEQQNGSCYI